MDSLTLPACPIRHPAAAALVRVAIALTSVARMLRSTARHLDASLAARAKAADDSLALLAMSERELRDIGIDPVRLGTMPDRWTRDGAV